MSSQSTLKILLAIVLSISECLSRDTKMLLVLARHGARYPVAAGIDERRKGEITENGLRMCYLLGKYIKSVYPTFFPQKFNYNQNFVLASGMPRTQMSAQALMLGIYDFGSLTDPLLVDKKYYTPEWASFDIEDDLKTPLPEGFQPVPVHSFQPEENYLFEPFNFDLCPKVKLFALQDGDQQGQELLGFVNASLDEIKAEGFDYTKILGTSKLDHSLNYYILIDYIIASKFAGKDVGLSEALYQKLYLLYSMVMVYVFHRDPQHAKFLFTELGREMSRHFEEALAALKNKDEHYNHFVLLHGHDINILTFLAISQLTSYDCLRAQFLGQPVKDSCYMLPPYASSLFFEVYAESGDFWVDLFYNGQEIAFCSQNVSEKCTADKFKEKLSSLVLSGDALALRETYCYQKEMSKNTMMALILAFNVGVIGVLAFLIFRYKKRLNEN